LSQIQRENVIDLLDRPRLAFQRWTLLRFTNKRTPSRRQADVDGQQRQRASAAVAYVCLFLPKKLYLRRVLTADNCDDKHNFWN
jgi:hypothetical protein